VFDEAVANWVVPGESKHAGRNLVGAGCGAGVGTLSSSGVNMEFVSISLYSAALMITVTPRGMNRGS